MTKERGEKPKEEFTGVRAKLVAYRDDNAVPLHKTLPRSGVKVAIPQFINHGHWMKAQRQAGDDIAKAQGAFVVEVVRFEGEKLTMADLQFIDAKDMLFLIKEVFGDDEDGEEGEAGNA